MFARLKRGLAATAFALAITTPAMAEAPAPVTMTEANQAIWSIAKPGGGTITMFGSVHLLPKDQGWRTPAFTEALAKADVVVFETPIADMQTPEMMTYLQQNMMNPPGVTLSTLLTAEEKAKVEAAANFVGAPFGALEPFRPWMAALQLAIGSVMKQGYDPNSGVDKLVEAEAKAAGKALDYFETAKEQLDIFVTLPPEEEKAFLVVGAADLVAQPDMMKNLLAAWATGDVATIDKIMNEGIDSSPALGKKLLEDRNAKWVEKITTTYMVDTKNYLIVVGAGHLAGGKSVQAMLRAKGIEVSGP